MDPIYTETVDRKRLPLKQLTIFNNECWLLRGLGITNIDIKIPLAHVARSEGEIMIEQLWAIAANNSSALARYLITYKTKDFLAFKKGREATLLN